MEEHIRFEVAGRIAYITLNRPEKRNALGPELISALTAVMAETESRPDIRVIIIKAAGKVFSAGADLAYLQMLQQNTYEENLRDSARLKDLFQAIYQSSKVVIAQVEGHAIAGGCGLAALCDMVFAVPEARFGYTEVKIGFIPALVACYLVRKLGEARVKELLLSGELITAETAAAYGLINFVVPAGEIAERVASYAENICNTTSGESVSRTKSLLQQVYELSLEDSLSAAVRANAEARGTADCRKGISAFLKKEPVTW
ncbi:MAG TPA: enoyl-CoA hydratase-related protein [Sphingobacteriaceae bacterium]